MQFKNLLDFVERIHVPSKDAEILSTEKPMVSPEIADRIGHSDTIKFAPRWVGNVTSLVFSITSLRYIGKNKIETKTHNKVIGWII